MLRSASRTLLRSHRSHNYVTHSNGWKHHYELTHRSSLGAARSLSNATPLRNMATTTTTTHSTPLSTEEISRGTIQMLESIDTLLSCKNTRSAVRYFQTMHSTGNTSSLTSEEYIKLIRLVRQSNDADLRSTVCRWFYHPRDTSPLSTKIIEDENVWVEILKLGLKQGKSIHATDISMLVHQFTKTFQLQQVQNVNSLNILMRLYGVLNRPDSITQCLEVTLKHPNVNSIEATENAIIGYAHCNQHTKVKDLLSTLDGSKELYTKLVKSFAFRGDIAQTRYFIEQIKERFNNDQDQGMLYLAFKVAIDHEFMRQVQQGYSTGNPVIFKWTERLRSLDASWESQLNPLSSTTEAPKDVVQCNNILEYLSKAHIMNPEKYPMEILESFFREKMPASGVQPNEFTFTILLRTYSRSQQYNDQGMNNTRLDKALDLFQELQQQQFKLDIRAAFHALYSACIPHHGQHYPFDYFSDVHVTQNEQHYKRRYYLDKRFFDIEKIMLDGRIRYDRQSLILALTCLGTSGQYRAMWNRWNLIKQSGLNRDSGLYRHVFALASMDKEQSQYALSVIKEELVRELPAKRVGWSTYVAMLNCCIRAQDPIVAKQILNTMPKAYDSPSTPLVNYYNQPQARGYYQPMLRACTMIPGLEAEADALFEQVQTPFDQILWRAAMYHAVQQGGENKSQKLQQLFTQYTMQRFEQSGKIPIPIRETAPVVPFPSGPYSPFDMQMINLYLASLVDCQEVSLALDVVKTLKDQQKATISPTTSAKLRLSGKTVKGFIELVKREQSDEDLKWLLNETK
ncbi:hypothetical protein BDA99DRAFT_510503 [Phascolomyces articulosus]|uniref:Uncharacterized protein n=1 Tax=Phascolomyces articulosus TaxID=60185 RepID=A0AAD5K9X4_9FUNG|nr:hypothetical protein BDA99DRAFT_510503 [Phascolomyces articulosus]